MVNISLRDKETWHDQKPSHPPVPKPVLDALEHAHNCTREYNERLNAELNKGEAGGVIDWTDVTILANRANDAERELLAARELALNTCTCSHDPNREDATCPVCVAANRERSDGEIFYGSDDYFTMKDVRDEMDTEGRE